VPLHLSSTSTSLHVPPSLSPLTHL
jgi:hypothetical protein